MNNHKKGHNFSTWIVAVGLTAIAAAGCAGGPLTAREKGAGIGALGGAAVGGVIGNAKGHPGAGAAIGPNRHGPSKETTYYRVASGAAPAVLRSLLRYLP